MDEEAFNMSLRKFLKQVGVTSQRELERVVAAGNLPDPRRLKVRMELTVDGTDFKHVVEDEIALQPGPA